MASVVMDNRAFRRLWLAGVAFQLATGLRRVAVPWLVLVRTGSPLQLGIALAIGSLDLLATPVVGPLTDRHRRRTVVAGSLAGYAATLFAVPVLAAWNVLTLPAVYAALFLLGVAQFAYHNARHAWVPELVADLDAANASIHGIGAVASVAFVAAGGAITALTTPLTAITATGVITLAALVPLVGVPESTTDSSTPEADDSVEESTDDSRPTDETERSTVEEPDGVLTRLQRRAGEYLRETRAGVTAIGSHGLWPVVVVSVGINLVAPAYGLLFAAIGELFGTALAYTALLVGYDLGKVAGNAIVPRLGWDRVTAIERGVGLIGLTTVAFGLLGPVVTEAVPPTIAVLALGGLTLVVGTTQPVFNVPSDGLVQRAVPDAERGTVLTVTNALYQLPFPLAYLAGGLIADRFSPYLAFVGAGGLLLLVFLVARATLSEPIRAPDGRPVSD